jgi:hypothetical protein
MNRAAEKLTTIEAVRECLARLSALIDKDAREAIAQALAVQAEPGLEGPVLSLRGAIFIDAGAKAKLPDVIEKGVKIMRALHASRPAVMQIRYNLANGLIALADLDATPHPGWYLATRPLRQEARELLDSVRGCGESELETQALTNLGNSLSRAYRWSEAYDAYVAALAVDASNGMAAGCAAQMLLWGASVGIGDPTKMQKVASRYAARAKANRSRVVTLAGEKAAEIFDSLPEDEQPEAHRPERAISPYLRFVARHHLALVPTIEGLDPHLRRWDSLRIHSLVEPVSAGLEAPPLFAMFNSIKANYLMARRLGYLALESESKIRDTGSYIDTLDYALYGVKPAMLLLAQRAAMDILDQIAVALNEYLAIGLTLKNIYFSTLWRESQNQPQWRAAIESEIAKGNGALIALGELAEDLADGGYLHRKRKSRHASTHRFTVLHDMPRQSRPCAAIEHVDIERFGEETIETLQAVRAAILYFVEAVARREHRQHSADPPIVQMALPPHHWVRGHR